MPEASRIKIISFPHAELLESLGSLPEGIAGAVWDLRTDPVGAGLDAIDAVVLPYQSATEVLPQLALVPQLKLVQTQTTGYEGVREAVSPDVAVATASGVHAAATAELAVGLMLASIRGIDAAVVDQQKGIWHPQRRLSLADRRVLLVGVGGIGTEIARRLRPFEVELTRVGTSARDDEYGHVHGTDELVQLASNTEILVVITPLNEQTHHLIDHNVLAALPDGALVVNVARGPVVDSDALTKEVTSGRIKCAIDVFDPEPIPTGHPLWSARNALITPHIGGDTSAFDVRIVGLLKRQLSALASGQLPENLVQYGRFI